jgi:hypothetical protein
VISVLSSNKFAVLGQKMDIENSEFEKHFKKSVNP